MPGFLKLIWLACWYVCARACARVCVCVILPPRSLITSHVKGTRHNRIMKFYGYSISLYDTAIDKLNRSGLSNTVFHECLPKKGQVIRYLLQKDYQAAPTSRSISVIKVSGQMRSDTFIRRLGFSFTVIFLT